MKLRAKAYLRIAAKKPIKNWREKYDRVDFYGGLAQVELDGKWGLVNQQGKVVIPLKYDSVGHFFEGLVGVELDGRWGFVNKTGKEVAPLKYDYVWPFHEGFAPVKLNGKYSFVDQQGNEVIELKYAYIGHFDEGIAAVELNGYYGYVDTTGKEIIPCVYDEEDLPEIKDIPALSLKIRKKYERDPEGLEFIRPEFDWKAWYEQVIK